MVALEDLIEPGVPQFGPLEDLLLGVLRPLELVVPRLKVGTLIPKGVKLPFALVRREPGAEASAAFSKQKSSHVQRALISIETFTDSADGDAKGAWLQETMRRVLLSARKRNTVIPGVGHFCEFQNASPAHRVADWATSTGVVQYSNLPQNTTRYEATYLVGHRPDNKTVLDPLELFT